MAKSAVLGGGFLSGRTEGHQGVVLGEVSCLCNKTKFKLCMSFLPDMK